MISVNTRGFHVTFENGWTVSVQWGPMNYCDHYHSRLDSAPLAAHNNNIPWRSSSAEIAAWDSNHKWHKFPGGDTVKGYVSPDEVALFISKISKKKKKKKEV